MTRCTNFWRNNPKVGQDALNMRSRPPMKYMQPRLSMSLLTFAVLGLGCSQSSTKYDAGITMFDEATITITPTAYSFPNVAVGQDSEVAKFTLTNIGYESTGPISHTIEGSNEFLITASTCGQPLAYMTTCDVSVIFRPLTAGPKSGRLTASATPGKSFTVNLSGQSQAPASVRLEPTVFDFNITPIPSPSAPSPMLQTGTFTVTNSGGSPVGPISADVSGQDASEFAISSNGCDGLLLQAGGTCPISVRFKPTTSGAKTAQLNVGGTGSIKLAPATLSGTGAEPAKITLTPVSQNFGNLPLGMKSAFSFEVSNEGGADAGKITASLQGINISEFSLAADPSCDLPLVPGTSCGITVTYAPTTIGTKTVSLRVAASPGGSVKADLSASAQPMSMGSLISVTSPAPDPFGTLAVGDSSTGFFVVENKGMTAVGKVMATVSGSNASEFTITDNGCPATLDIGAVCGITVRFAPEFAGRRTANLQATALPAAFAILPIAGSASAAPTLRISPTTRNFGNRNVGSTTGTVSEFIISSSSSLSTTGALNVVVEGTDAPNWQVVYNECQNVQLMQGRTSCRVGLRFVPVSTGNKTASLAASATPGGVVRATIYGNGT
jgi:hypothetical protein